MTLYNTSEPVEIRLGSYSIVVGVIISLLCPDIPYHTDGQKVEIRYGQLYLK